MKIIKATDLTKIYKQGEDEVKALDGVSLDIEEGSFVAITGESGSGKSTLLNILGCMDKPTSGSVVIDSIEAKDDKAITKLRCEKIGMIFQAFHLLPMLTAEENICMPGQFSGHVIEKDELEMLFRDLGLEGREKHLPSQLSGGQQQRVAIGRALANKPKILFADEPTGNLDKKNSNEIISLMLKMKEKYNMTLVMVTHSEKIAEMADRRIYMEDGRIISDELQGAGKEQKNESR